MFKWKHFLLTWTWLSTSFVTCKTLSHLCTLQRCLCVLTKWAPPPSLLVIIMLLWETCSLCLLSDLFFLWINNCLLTLCDVYSSFIISLTFSLSFSSLCGRNLAVMLATSTRSLQRWRWSWHRQTSSSSWIWTRTSFKASPTPTLNSSYKSEEFPLVRHRPAKA